jgi:hypothetical protein
MIFKSEEEILPIQTLSELLPLQLLEDPRQSLLHILETVVSLEGLFNDVHRKFLLASASLSDGNFLLILSAIITIRLCGSSFPLSDFQLIVESFLAGIALNEYYQKNPEKRAYLYLPRVRDESRIQIIQFIGWTSLGVHLLEIVSSLCSTLSQTKKSLVIDWKNILDGRLICSLFWMAKTSGRPLLDILESHQMVLADRFKELLENTFAWRSAIAAASKIPSEVNINEKTPIDGIPKGCSNTCMIFFFFHLLICHLVVFFF